jgi:hypothetical protein
VDLKEVYCVCMWKLNEAEEFETWCEIHLSTLTKGLFVLFPIVMVNINGLIVVIDLKI